MSTFPPLTLEACRAHLDEATFKLRPASYGKRYPKWPGAVGLEIEMLPLRPARQVGGLPSPVTLQGPSDTLAAILLQFAEQNAYRVESTHDDHGQPLLLNVFLEDEDNISFEPGGQLEFSSKPYPCLSDAVRRMRSVQVGLDQLLAAHDIRVVQTGINPWHTVAELGLQMQKARYRAMDEHFSRISTFGRRMMRQTCTIQVNIDLGPDTNVLGRRYLASQLLAPIATATFAYSPIVDRAVSGARSFRSRIWRHADGSRTGLPGIERLAEEYVTRGELSRETCIDTYLQFVLGAQVVFIQALDYKVPDQPITFGEWISHSIAGVQPTIDDLKTHMSLLFPEVRPRGFLELRSIDCQPRAFEAVPASYMVGLLYAPAVLDRLLELLLPHRAKIHTLLQHSESGLRDPDLARLARQVMRLAVEGFASLSSCFKAEGSERELATFCEHFTDRERTPADDLLDRLASDQASYPTLDMMQALEEDWTRCAGG